ncbi:DNA polymerase III subunit delta' [Salinarimonas soli]|uniref:DNA polymerase III subunit delta n=1 Tax=Salinarimonas soli TaxID=1638099 RepID=A0A5B2VRZ7_9HYPH|nr:DNA polymerase III subunit delta' [Salinarimonas soli]KAA2241116.1 DNA polymerase III subunit delta' [Salinarimonas soli]
MKAPSSAEIEPDALQGAPHPRERLVLFGQTQAEASVLDAYAAGRLHHAWLIGGPQGIGKATFAYRVARFLLAQTPGAPRPGGSLAVSPDSPVARQVAAQAHPNLMVLRRQPATEKKGPSTTIPVETVRKAVSMFGSTAANGGYRVCIVDSAEDLTTASANALLKLVEEPPARSVFLIVAHRPQSVLPTIRSRCRRLLLRPLEPPDLRDVIGSLGSPWSEAPGEDVTRAIELSEGSARRCLEMLDPARARLVESVRAMLDRLPEQDLKRVLTLAESLAKKDAEADYELALETVERWIGDRISAAAGAGPARLAPLVEVCDKIRRSAREVDVYNLDRRPLVLTLFGDLADAVRAAA